MEREGLTILFLQADGRSFAVETGQVETLRRKETVLPAQQGPPDLLGFLPLGGAVVPIVDLAMRLGIQGSMGKQAGLLLVPPEKVAPLAFRVDRIDGPHHVEWDALALLPELLRQLQPRPIIWAVIRQGERLVPLLDLGQIVPPGETTALLDLAKELC